MKNRLQSIVFLIVTVAVLSLGVVSAFVWKGDLPGLVNGDLVDMNDGWYSYDNARKVLLDPFPSTLYTDGSITIHHQVPTDFAGDFVLCFETNHKKLECFADGKIIYEYQTGLGNVWHLISIPSGTSEVAIQLLPLEDFGSNSISLYSVFAGNGGTVAATLLRGNMFPMLFSIFVAAVCVLLFFLVMFLHSRGVKFNLYGFLYLIAFALLSAVWILTDSKISIFLFNHLLVVYYLSFASFMLMPIPYLLYLKTILPAKGKILTAFSGLFAANAAVCLLLNLAQVLPLYRTVTLTHLLIAAVIVWSLTVFSYDYWKNKDSTVLFPLAGMALFCLGAVFSFFNFYGKPYTSNYSTVFLYSLIVFIALLAVQLVKSGLHLFKASVESDIYKKLAVFDPLTEMNNRAAFDLDLRSMGRRAPEYTSLAFIVLDLNNLKTVNDKDGHFTGDLLLKNAGNCIRKAFSEEGSCYRIGGDEFVVILKNLGESRVQAAVSLFREVLKAQNEGAKLPVSIACGYAIGHRFTNERDLYALFQEADAKMYEDKRKSKM